MVTFTANKALGLPAVGGDAGVWGPPLNNNSSALDASLGGSVTIPISSVSGALTLLASNYQNVFITFTGTLSQHTAITLPAVGSFYVIQNQCGAPTSFRVTLLTTAVGSQQIGVPPFEQTEIWTDGANVKFRGLPHVGSYWDYAGNSIPLWVSGCTVPPWLNCDGSAFSAVTYPYLNALLGGNTLPDSRGRTRATLNQGTGRLNSVISDSVGSAGGDQFLMNHTHSMNAAATGISVTPSGGGSFVTNPGGVNFGPGGVTNLNPSGAAQVNDPSHSHTINAAGAGGGQNVQPTYMGGLTLIRAG